MPGASSTKEVLDQLHYANVMHLHQGGHRSSTNLFCIKGAEQHRKLPKLC